MTIYRDKAGREIVVCDGCGVDCDGRKVDTSKLTPVDLTSAVLAMGAAAGTKLTVKDWCPTCRPQVVRPH